MHFILTQFFLALYGNNKQDHFFTKLFIMKRTLKFYKNAGTALLILGIMMLCYFAKDSDGKNTEVLVRCLGAFLFVAGGTAHIYVDEQQNNKPDVY